MHFVIADKARVQRQLRRGGFGEAKLEHPMSGNEYAKLGARVKLINLHTHTELNEKEGAIKEFYRNGRIGVQVSHPEKEKHMSPAPATGPLSLTRS